jgi:NAD+ diphosphatase
VAGPGPDLCYSDACLDRVGYQRLDPVWIAGLLASGDVRVIPVWRDRCVVSGDQPVPVTLAGQGRPRPDVAL